MNIFIFILSPFEQFLQKMSFQIEKLRQDNQQKDIWPNDTEPSNTRHCTMNNPQDNYTRNNAIQLNDILVKY
jgi:hypothetical protein